MTNSGKNLNFLNQLFAMECQDATYRPHAAALVMDKGQDSRIWDVEGKVYIDLCAGFGSLPLGHMPSEVWSQFPGRCQIIQGLGDVYPSRSKIEYMSKIMAVMPSSLQKMAFALSGSQAVEYAMKTAMLATQGNGFIAFEDAYHGLDLGALSLTSRKDFKDPFKSWLHQVNVQHLPLNCAQKLIEEALSAQIKNGIKPAGIIVEPVQARGGLKKAEDSWLETLRQLCDKWNILLIYDEVFTGMGRIGQLTKAFDVPCDLLCLGKALGGGMPLSACVGTMKVMDSWPECRSESLHTGTFFGHPLACWVGSQTLETMISQRLVQRSQSWGQVLKIEMDSLFSKLPQVKEIKGCGLMLGIQFHQEGYAARLMQALRVAGVIALPCGPKSDCLSITPALNIKEDLFYEALNIIKFSIENLD